MSSDGQASFSLLPPDGPTPDDFGYTVMVQLPGLPPSMQPGNVSVPSTRDPVSDMRQLRCDYLWWWLGCIMLHIVYCNALYIVYCVMYCIVHEWFKASGCRTLCNCIPVNTSVSETDTQHSCLSQHCHYILTTQAKMQV